MAENMQNYAKPLTGRQLEVISLLSAGIQQREVCKRIGIHETTLLRWRKLPQFQEELKKQKRGLLNKALDCFLSSVEEVAKKMIALTDAKNENVRLRACQAIMDNVKEGIDLISLKERIERLEKLIEGLNMGDTRKGMLSNLKSFE